MTFLKKIRLYSWTIKAFFKKHGKTIFLGLFTGIIIFAAIAKIFPLLPKPKKHQRIGLVGKYNLDNIPSEILLLLGKGLTSVDTEGAPLPALAESWIVSDDGLNYTFKLKDKIFWQDGKKIKAEEIVYDFKDVLRTVLDVKTIQFTLKEPYAPFPNALSKPIFREKFIGSGPYKIQKIKKNGDLIAILQLTGLKQNITYKFYPTVEAAGIAFKLGEVDILTGIFINPFDELWQNNIISEYQINKDKFVGLFFNNNDSLLGNKSLRQALNYSIKKKSDETKAIGPISPDSWAFSKEVKEYNFDPNHAKELLKKFNEESEDKIILKISTSQAFLGLAEEMSQSWHEVLGIETEIEIISVFKNDYQIFLGLQETPRDPDQYAFWHSTRPENITNFNDPKVDKLLEDGRKIFNKEDRKNKYADFQRFLLEESPVVFLEYPKLYTLSRKPVLF